MGRSVGNGSGRLRREAFRLLLICAAAFAALSLSYSWFFRERVTGAGGGELRPDRVSCLLIREGEDHFWAMELSLETEEILSPITGDGVSFFSPVTGRAGGPDRRGGYALTLLDLVPIAPEELSDRALVRDFRLRYEEDAEIVLTSGRITALEGNMDPAALRLALLEKTGAGWGLKLICSPENWAGQKLTELTAYGEKEFRLILWLEGTAPECGNPLAGSRFRLELRFGVKDGTDETNGL